MIPVDEEDEGIDKDMLEVMLVHDGDIDIEDGEDENDIDEEIDELDEDSWERNTLI